MSVTDDLRADLRTPGLPAAPPADGQFEKTPPQDIAAEQCVLGGMLLSKDAIADVVEILKASDFYRPVHATIFDAILDLYGRGEPADAITVAAALADSGDLARIGGAPYLHTLIASVPTAANAAYYARIVGERAVLRRLVEAGTRIVQLGYGSASGGGRDVDDVVDLAQQAIYEVTERRVSEDFAVLADMLQPTLDEIEAVGAQGGVMTGVPTGFSDLDRLLNGLHPGQLVIVAGRPGLGKALALDTPLPTPTGWTTMGAVRAGDQLLGADGRPTTVTHAFDIRYDRPCYAVEFADGEVIVADAEHLWRTVDATGGAPGVHTTDEIAASLRDPQGRFRHLVINTRPLTLPDRRDLPLSPYVLGVWLGDPGARGAEPGLTDPELVMRVEAEGVNVRATGSADRYVFADPFADRLRAAGVTAERHIPAAYLRASEAQRRALLAGLLDVAGTVDDDGAVRVRVADTRLAEEVRELLVGLGYPCPPVPASADTITFTTADDVFRLAHKRLAHKELRPAVTPIAARARAIVAVRPVPSVPVRCVSVDNADHLYLAGRAMVPTHNSTASMDFARNAAIRHNCASAIFSLEMSKVEIVMRLLSAEARVPLHVLRSGQLSDDDWTKLARCMGEISGAPLFVDDTPNMNLMEIRAKARRLKQRHDLKMIVVDYLQLMSSPKRTESRQQEVAELSRGLKLLAKEVECPVIAVSQLNRGPEQRTDKRPQLSDLRESGCLTAATRLIRADTNTEVTLGELLATGARDIPVWALDEKLRYVPRTMTHVFPSGTRQTFRLTLASGRSVEATANHPFLTVNGWRALGDLDVGTKIAAPRHLPPPLRTTARPEAEVVAWANRLGTDGWGELPGELFTLPKRQITLFLRHLWSLAGRVDVADGISLVAGRRLLDGVALLLLRYGISSRLCIGSAGRLRHRLEITERDDRLRFLREIGVAGPRGGECATLLATLERDGSGRGAVPTRVWAQVREALLDRADARREPVGAATPVERAGLAGVAEVLATADLELHATNDVGWDAIVAIEPIGLRDVYDATVLGLHNFIANGIAVHNSIEQDADVVILLHRDDYYDKESPRAGEADFIVAKHRNGPTDTVTVAAQLHLSRFVDMAIV